jgi:sporulation protein YlmC with PRC-barrel domain
MMTTLIRMIATTALALAMAAPVAAQTAPGGTSKEPAEKTMESAPATNESRPLSNVMGGNFLVKQKEDQVVASKIIGMPVLNAEEKEIGEIADLILNEQQQVVGTVLSVGGFLGLGSKSVAVPWESVRIRQSANGQVAIVAMSEKELAVAPEFHTLDEQKAAEKAEADAMRRMEMKKSMTPISPSTSPKPSQ